MRYIALAFASGIPALVYQVAWTREVALAVGSQIEAISAVLVSFFGGLALGAWVVGRRMDSIANPLRTYAQLEGLAGALAVPTPFVLVALGEPPWLGLPDAVRLLLCGMTLAPITFLLGGTLPALVRGAVRDPEHAPRGAGRIVAANTAGAVVGVIAAASLIPVLGLRITIGGSGLVAVGIAAIAFTLARTAPPRRTPARGSVPTDRARLPAGVLAVATLAGVATLSFEVFAARIAALRLGSSLFAWAAVLGLTLVGLALGNAIGARGASRSPRPLIALGWLEVMAAFTLAMGLGVFLPTVAEPAPGASARSLVALVAGVLPPALLAGVAFPFFVRLAVGDRDTIGASFGALSAANTAGGILGSLLAAFVLLPVFGLRDGALACGGINAALGMLLLGAGSSGRRRWLAPAAALAVIVVGTLPVLLRQPSSRPERVIFVAEGRQATAVVVRTPNRRDLIVDGESEASTFGDARATEELLAILPLLLHPHPRSFLEVGLGSGITLGTALRFPLERVECVEIAASVLAAAPFFAPDNGDPTASADPRLRILRADGRAHLARQKAAFDVVAANTVQPWSLAATGLYSHEYFSRIAESLRPGGIAVQWLPIQRLEAVRLAAILRTWFSVFPEGALWWGADDLLAVGSDVPLAPLAATRFDALPPEGAAALRRMGVGELADLAGRRLADGQVVREVVGPGMLLSDDRPILEAPSVGERGGGEALATSRLIEQIATAASRDDPQVRPLLLWLKSRRARSEGDAQRADGLEEMAVAAQLALARQSRLERVVESGRVAFHQRQLPVAQEAFERALREDPDNATALFGLAAIRMQVGNLTAAEELLQRLLAAHGQHAEGWNALAAVRSRQGDLLGARQAAEAALVADPYFPEALANAGLLAVEAGDLVAARNDLEQLRAIGIGVPSPEEKALRRTLDRVDSLPPERASARP